jgi:F-type H+-transporting ATPase subunit alpha
MVATLNQPQYQPWPMEEQVVAIYAGINGWLDKIPVGQVPRFHAELREHLKTEGTVYAAIRETGDLTDEIAEKLVKELEHFQGVFNIAEEKGLAG